MVWALASITVSDHFGIFVSLANTTCPANQVRRYNILSFLHHLAPTPHTFHPFHRRVMLLTLLSFVAAASASSWASIEQRQTTASSNCTTGVHMIVARATGEAPGIGGLLANVVLGILEYIPGSDYLGVDYPASWIEYGESVAIGVASTIFVQASLVACPMLTRSL